MSKIVVDSAKIHENLCMVNDLCVNNEARLNLVSKVALSKPCMIDFFHESGVDCISDSNVRNYEMFTPELSSKITKCVIKTRLSDIQRIPSLNESAVPDRLFVSDKVLLDAVMALPKEKRPQIVLIAEIGDFRDGMYPEQIYEAAENYSELDIIGISANFSCLIGELPSAKDIEKLALIARTFSEKRGLESPFLSIGGTVIYDIAKSGDIKGLAQEFRIGEAVFFGRNTSGNCVLPGFNIDAITLSGEIIEVSAKDVIQPKEEGGLSAIGIQHNTFNQVYGKRKRCVMDFGVLISEYDHLYPFDKSIFPSGQTYDFTVVDITNSKHAYSTGDYIDFATDYASFARAVMNPYVDFDIR